MDNAYQLKYDYATEKPYEYRTKDGKINRIAVFKLLHQANLKASRLGEYAICIFGQTRVGKSTLHNYIVNPQVLLGKDEGTNTFYVLKNQNLRNNPEVAFIDNSMKSVTIMPNISLLPGQKIYVVDFPGFGERGNEIQVLEVNYIIAKFLHSTKKTKFLLAFSEASFKDLSHAGFRDTLHNFLSLFNVQQFSQFDVKKKLFSSISFCLTSVDFRGKKYDLVKEKFIDQLQKNLVKLEELYKADPESMTTFPFAKGLILDIIASKRLELFELAEDAQIPTSNNFIQRLNNKNWEFFNLRANIEKIVCQYNDQYQNLKEDQRTNLDELINWRIGLCPKIRSFIGEMLKIMRDNIGDKRVDVSNQFASLEETIAELPEYGENLKIQTHPLNSIEQRLNCFENLCQSTQKIKDFQQWKAENSLSFEELYFTQHLTDLFTYQMSIVSSLFAWNENASRIFSKILTHVTKLLAEAAILSKLSQNLKSRFNRQFVDSLIFANEINNLESVKLSFIDYFHNRQIREGEYSPEEIKRILKAVVGLKIEPKLNPCVFYAIGYKLRLQLARLYKRNELIIESLEQNFYALIQAVKAHCCLFLKPLSSYSENLKLLIVFQSEVLKQLAGLITRFQNNTPLIQIHMQLKLAFDNLSQTKDQNEFRSIVEVIWHIINIFSGYFTKIKLTNEAQMPIAISLSKNGGSEVDMILNEYSTVMKAEILEDQMKVQIPKQSSINDITSYYEKVLQKMKNKSVIFIFGKKLCGKSLFLNILKGKKIQFNKDGKYDIAGKGNRINHSKNPDPFLHLNPKDENQVFIEVPSFFELPPDQKLIRISILLSLAKNASKFRAILIEEEKTFKDKSYIPRIKELSNLFVQFGIRSQDKKTLTIHNLSLIINPIKITLQDAKAILIEHINSINKTEEQQLFDVLDLIKKRNYFFCRNISKSKQLYNDVFFLFEKYFYPEGVNFKVNQLTAYQKCFKQAETETMLKRIEGKIKLLVSAVSPLVGLASDSLAEFQKNQRLSQKNWYHTDIHNIVSNVIATEYVLDVSDSLKFQLVQSQLTNRTFIYNRIMEIKRKGPNLCEFFQYELTFQLLSNYMETFFNNLAYICCNNQLQYTNFMKLKVLFRSILKEIEFYGKLFKVGKAKYEQLRYLDQSMRMRTVTDEIDNFTNDGEMNLLKRLIIEKDGYRFNEAELRNYVELLNEFSKKENQTVTVAAKIELFIFTTKFKNQNQLAISWDNDLIERKLIRQIISFPEARSKAPQSVRDYAESLGKKLNEQILKDLATTKMRLLTI